MLKQMINAARSKKVNRRHSHIMKGDRSGLDYIEVPNDKWYYSLKHNEIYQFTDGLFLAHPCTSKDLKEYSLKSVLKKLPKEARIATITLNESCITLVSSNENHQPTWTKICKQHDIEGWLLRRNKKHHQQVHNDNSPHVTGEIGRIFQDNDLVDRILEGSQPTEELDVPDYAKDWFETLKKTPSEAILPKLETLITPKRYAEVFKKAKEKVSSSPRGLHYTLWKSLAEVEDFCILLSVMMALPFMYEFSNKRWQHAIDAMLKKLTGVRHIHLMRIIGLVEPDYNCGLKFYYADRLMKNAEASGLSSNQLGGRANRSAPACATRKLLTLESSRITKTSIGFGSADKSNCFDRLTNEITNVVSKKRGMSQTTCDCDNKVMDGMERSVKTAAGVSAQSYKTEPGDIKQSGKVQDKASVVCQWTLTADKMLVTYERKMIETSNHFRMTSADYDTEIARMVDMYVDDASHMVGSEHNDFFLPQENITIESDFDEDPDLDNSHLPTEEVTQNLTSAWWYWANLTYLVAQFPSFHKYKYQILTWANKNCRCVPADKKVLSGEIAIKDHYGHSHQIEQEDNNQSIPGLGFEMTPLGNQDPQFEKTLKLTKECGHRLRLCGKMVAGEAWLLLQTRVMPKIAYPLALTSFTTKQCLKLSVILDNVMLPKLGINRKMKRTVIYAPRCLGGTGYPSIS